MKLITETTFEEVNSVSVVNESTGTRNWYIEGIFAQAEKVNRNGRTYPNGVLEREINRYHKEFVLTNRALGELNHPDYPRPDPALASHRIVEMSTQGPDYWGKALVLNTPRGLVLQGLLEGGTQMGVSTRGAGTIRESVVEEYRLFCVDAVSDPSGIDCWTNGILEGREFAWQNDNIVEVAADKALKQIKQMKQVDEVKLAKLFEQYIRSI